MQISDTTICHVCGTSFTFSGEIKRVGTHAIRGKQALVQVLSSRPGASEKLLTVQVEVECTNNSCYAKNIFYYNVGMTTGTLTKQKLSFDE